MIIFEISEFNQFGLSIKIDYYGLTRAKKPIISGVDQQWVLRKKVELFCDWKILGKIILEKVRPTPKRY